jgi:hypothetical protein
MTKHAMQTAIRVGAVLVMSATWTPAFAEENDAATGENESQTTAMIVDADTAPETSGDAVGGGSGEPRSAVTHARTDARATEGAASQDYSQSQFLQGVWRAAP